MQGNVYIRIQQGVLYCLQKWFCIFWKYVSVNEQRKIKLIVPRFQSRLFNFMKKS